jgi:hypothetical protein
MASQSRLTSSLFAINIRRWRQFRVQPRDNGMETQAKNQKQLMFSRHSRHILLMAAKFILYVFWSKRLTTTFSPLVMTLDHDSPLRRQQAAFEANDTLDAANTPKSSQLELDSALSDCSMSRIYECQVSVSFDILQHGSTTAT